MTAITLPPIAVHAVRFDLIGDSPLIVHAWSEKAKRQMLDKQMKKAASAKAAKDPEADYQACFYRLPDGRYGFPTIGLKAAMISACRFADLKMTVARGAFHIDGAARRHGARRHGNRRYSLPARVSRVAHSGDTEIQRQRHQPGAACQSSEHRRFRRRHW